LGARVKYTKPPTTPSQQIQMLADRGMQIPDPDAARFYLAHIGYYRLRGYWIPFENTQVTAGKHAFKPGVAFDQILNLYTFDRELRLLAIGPDHEKKTMIEGLLA